MTKRIHLPLVLQVRSAFISKLTVGMQLLLFFCRFSCGPMHRIRKFISHWARYNSTRFTIIVFVLDFWLCRNLSFVHFCHPGS